MNLFSPPRRPGLAPSVVPGDAAENLQPSLDHYLRSPELNNFNLLRLLAATAVAFGHSFALSLNGVDLVEPTTKVLPFTYCGDIAVDVFFLISGIFVSQSLFYERNAASFAVKRFARIWPGLVVCLIVSVALVIAVSPGIRADLLRDPATYTYILNNSVLKMQWGIPGVFEGRPQEAINGSLWTLPLEAKMYCVVLIFGVLGILYSSSMTLLAAIVIALVLLVFPEKVSADFNAQNKEPNEVFWSGLRRNWSGIALPVLVIAVAALGFTLAPVPSADAPPKPLDAKIVGFGPLRVVHGRPFNKQPSGGSAIWVKLDRPARQEFVLVLAGERLPTLVKDNSLTAEVRPELYSTPGPLQLYVEMIRYGRILRSNPVVVEVQ
ncbi:MAG: acyltransferase family protein [Methyloceanibacter sp.]